MKQLAQSPTAGMFQPGLDTKHSESKAKLCTAVHGLLLAVS